MFKILEPYLNLQEMIKLGQVNREMWQCLHDDSIWELRLIEDFKEIVDINNASLYLAAFRETNKKRDLGYRELYNQFYNYRHNKITYEQFCLLFLPPEKFNNFRKLREEHCLISYIPLIAMIAWKGEFTESHALLLSTAKSCMPRSSIPELVGTLKDSNLTSTEAFRLQQAIHNVYRPSIISLETKRLLEFVHSIKEERKQKIQPGSFSLSHGLQASSPPNISPPSNSPPSNKFFPPHDPNKSAKPANSSVPDGKEFSGQSISNVPNGKEQTQIQSDDPLTEIRTLLNREVTLCTQKNSRLYQDQTEYQNDIAELRETINSTKYSGDSKRHLPEINKFLNKFTEWSRSWCKARLQPPPNALMRALTDLKKFVQDNQQGVAPTGCI